MRVLAIVLGAIVAAAVACYTPTIADCQFQCATTGTPCPDGFTCNAGFCRSATGACPAGTVDAGSSCPMPPNNCGSAVVVGDVCMTACGGPGGTALTYDAAKLACQGAAGWHLATLDNAVRLGGAPQVLPPDWVGARRAGSGAPFVWTQTGSAVPLGQIVPLNAMGDCLAVTAQKTLTNDNCSIATGSNALHRFVCDTHP